MTLKEFRRTIYDGLKELGAELNARQLEFLSDKIKEYAREKNKFVIEESTTKDNKLKEYKEKLFGANRKQPKKIEKKIAPKIKAPVKKPVYNEDTSSAFHIPKDFRSQ